MESRRCKNNFTFHFQPPALALVSLIGNTEPSVVRLALEPRERIQPAKGGSVKIKNLSMLADKFIKKPRLGEILKLDYGNVLLK